MNNQENEQEKMNIWNNDVDAFTRKMETLIALGGQAAAPGLAAKIPSPENNHKEAFCHMLYATEDRRITITVWNSRDGVTPFCFVIPGLNIEVQHINWSRDVYDPNFKPQPGNFIWRNFTQTEAEEAAQWRMQHAVDHGFDPKAAQELYTDALRDIINMKQPKLEIIKAAETNAKD